MHHALLSLMLMSGACGDAPAKQSEVSPPSAVARHDEARVITDLFAPRTKSFSELPGAERTSANCQAK